MTAIRSTLQKSVFQSDDERLVSFAHIIKVDNKKKKKETFLCLAVTLEQPISVRLYFVKNEKDDVLRKREKFNLRDVRIIDGINPRKPICEFNMLIADKEYQLSAATYEDKECFIRQLYKLANKYLPVQKPEFVNYTIPVEALVPQTTLSEPSDELVMETGADYQPISAKEEADFRRLLAKSNLTIGQAKKFYTLLTEQLMQLDGANVESIMNSEQGVTELINLLDSALDEAMRLEQLLDDFDGMLAYVRDSVELIEEKDSLRHIERTNLRKLMAELNDFLYSMDTVSDEHVNILKNAHLSDPTSINRCCVAARSMSNFLHKKTPLSSMVVYQERMELLNRVSGEFVDRLFSHLTALFENMNALLVDQQWNDLSLQKQSQRHKALSPFSDLMSWLKSTRPQVYQNTIERYVKTARVLYEREFDRFFNNIYQRINRLNDRASIYDDAIEQAFIELLETVMGETRTIVESEQKFVVRFFHISSDLLATLETQSTSSGDSGGILGGKSIERQFNDQIRSVVQPMFSNFMPHVQKFIDLATSSQPLVLLSLYVVLSKKMHIYQDASSYFSVLYGSSMILFKQGIDSIMASTANSYANVSKRITKKSRVGILPSITEFGALAAAAEKIFGQSERRTDLEKWHERLIEAVISGIYSSAESPNSKSPPAVMKFENFHQLFLTLSELKISCLDGKRKEIKKTYQENIKAYVSEYMGRPLERIHLFFEQVENAINKGIKPGEIGYQPQFSRMELKKVISAYPGREVKKGLENLYKKVEKHLIDQSPLLQVVWRDMQEEFLNQLKHYQQIIGRCYPNSRIDLEVSIQDVLGYFSEIAQQH